VKLFVDRATSHSRAFQYVAYLLLDMLIVVGVFGLLVLAVHLFGS
jgi:hypothetical protein